MPAWKERKWFGPKARGIPALKFFLTVDFGTYQWQFDGTNLVNATNSVLLLTNVQSANAGAYSVVVSNAFGANTNFAALATAPTTITSVPQSQTIFPNGTVKLSLGLQAIIPVACRWFFNGTTIDGATNSSLTLTNVTCGQGGIYTIVFSDAYEAVTNSATVSVVPVASWGDHGQWNMPPGLTNLLAVACGDFHGLALNADGTVTGWGSGFVPAPAGLTNVVAISAGNNDSLALRDDGTVVAWGEKWRGSNERAGRPEQCGGHRRRRCSQPRAKI